MPQNARQTANVQKPHVLKVGLNQHVSIQLVSIIDIMNLQVAKPTKDMCYLAMNMYQQRSAVVSKMVNTTR